MSTLLAILLTAASLSQPSFEALPEAIGSVNCPAPPRTISTVEGRIYECRPEEGADPYQDVTPPDEKAHWLLPFGNANLPPNGTASYHAVKDWPFRAVLSSGNPVAPGLEYFYVFDRTGVVVDSNEPGAIGDQMMEVRISGIRMWPTANVYYRLPPAGKKPTSNTAVARIGQTGRYAFVVADGTLCPVLDESHVSSWSGAEASPAATGTYINGHCVEVYRIQPSKEADFAMYPHQADPAAPVARWLLRAGSAHRHNDGHETARHDGIRTRRRPISCCSSHFGAYSLTRLPRISSDAPELPHSLPSRCRARVWGRDRNRR
ncbi:hypothetical protein [Stenotrophomonas rhizophila]|uniref:hypothetical protein n=1 Tax=Stenotrophomonas rhizophila TaxID=216778 RepID=UPI0028D61057|nr:hypothetical protein [Stenotrophomonas rhizophila]